MTKVKKWQCPHCPQDSPRHWNALVHIKRKHGGVGAPIEKGNMSQHSSSSPGSGGRSTQNVKHPSQYSRSNYLYTNHANNDSKGDEDVIDKWYQMVLEQEEKERKIRKIKEFYCRNPDAPMPIPNIDISNLPIKKRWGKVFQKFLVKMNLKTTLRYKSKAFSPCLHISHMQDIRLRVKIQGLIAPQLRFPASTEILILNSLNLRP